MDRGDILAQLQTTSTTDTCILSITDETQRNMNQKPSTPVIKLISSANDLEQRFDLDKMPSNTRHAIINKFLSSSSATFPPSSASLTKTTTMNDSPISTYKLAELAAEHHDDLIKGTSSIIDAQTTIKNKRKNFQPRSVASVNESPPLTDNILLNLMMRNKMKMFEQNNQYGRLVGDAINRMISSTNDTKTAYTSHGEENATSMLDDKRMAQMSTSPSDGGLDGECPNAYTAVQELLEFYGLDMSSSRIADMFGKKSDSTSPDAINSGKFHFSFFQIVFLIFLLTFSWL